MDWARKAVPLSSSQEGRTTHQRLSSSPDDTDKEEDPAEALTVDNINTEMSTKKDGELEVREDSAGKRKKQHKKKKRKQHENSKKPLIQAKEEEKTESEEENQAPEGGEETTQPLEGDIDKLARQKKKEVKQTKNKDEKKKKESSKDKKKKSRKEDSQNKMAIETEEDAKPKPPKPSFIKKLAPDHVKWRLPSPRDKDKAKQRRKAKIEQLRLNYPHRYASRHEPKREDFWNRTPWPWLDHLLYVLVMRLSLFKSFISLITLHGLFVCACAVGSTYFCHHFGIHTDQPLSLLSAGIVFPISFGIGYTMSRREQCLNAMASLKCSAISLYYMHRDWDSEATYTA